VQVPTLREYFQKKSRTGKDFPPPCR